MSDAVVKMEGISKAFAGIKALDSVQIELRKGEIHALMGENGAGKSTLMKIMCGVYAKDSGRMLLENENTGEFEEVEIKTPLMGQKQDSVWFFRAKSSGEYEYCREYFYRKRTCKKEWVS